MKEQLDAVTAKVKKLAGSDSAFADSLKVQAEAAAAIEARTNEAIKNYTNIYGLMVKTQSKQAELTKLTNEQNKYILIDNDSLNEKITLQNSGTLTFT